MGRLDGRIALVTGGIRGIGAGIVRKLADEGADVAILDMKLGAEAEDVLGYARNIGVWAEAIQGDVSQSADVNRAVEAVQRHRGRIDILVNDAGICPFRDLWSITDDIWQTTIGVNLSGMFYTSRAVAPIMKAQQSGVIINVSTVSTQVMAPHQVHYIASKGGVDALTRALAYALAPFGIRVNAIAPAGALTDINANVQEQQEAWEKSGVPRRHGNPPPLNRIGEPEDYANGVCFLASDESNYITGIVLPIDGGTLLR